MDLAALIGSYGYWAVAVGCLLEGETVLLLAGFAAHRGYLEWPWVMAVAMAAGFAGDMGFFLLGRRFGPQILARWPRIAAQRSKVDAWLARRGAWVVLALRFLYGFRIAGPVLIGLSGMPRARFALFNALGAMLWAVLLTGIGWFFGQAAELLLGELNCLRRSETERYKVAAYRPVHQPCGGSRADRAVRGWRGWRGCRGHRLRSRRRRVEADCRPLPAAGRGLRLDRPGVIASRGLKSLS